jgi:hypothetical protein
LLDGIVMKSEQFDPRKFSAVAIVDDEVVAHPLSAKTFAIDEGEIANVGGSRFSVNRYPDIGCHPFAPRHCR